MNPHFFLIFLAIMRLLPSKTWEIKALAGANGLILDLSKPLKPTQLTSSSSWKKTWDSIYGGYDGINGIAFGIINEQ